MKKRLLLCSTIAATAIAFAQPPAGPGGPGGPGRFGGPRGGGFGGDLGILGAGPGSRTPITGAPFSAVESTSTQQQLVGGNTISRTEQTKLYRDSAGRVRTERTFTPPNGTAQTRITIFDPVAGASYVLDPANLTAVKMTFQPKTGTTTTTPPTPPTQGPHGEQIQTETLPATTVNGVAATGTRTTITIPAGAIGNAQPIQTVREVWTSTALKIPVQITTTDPRFGKTTMNLTNIVQGEPDPTLFQVPSNYTVTTRGPGAGGHAMGPQFRHQRPQ